ncbi:hypothetical protein D3C84_1265110 [compost metagenome]
MFAPNSDELAATLQMLVHGALQQWLGDRLRIDEVRAESRESTLSVLVRYTVLRTQESASASFERRL